MAAEHAALVGARIREAREAAGMSQRELAEALPGKSDGTQVSKWERGLHRVGDGTLEHIAKALDRDMAWFHTSAPDKSSTPDPFAARHTGDASELAQIRAQLARIDERLDQLVGLLAGDPGTQGDLFDEVVKTVERGLSRQAREAGRPSRKPAVGSDRRRGPQAAAG